MGRGAGADLAPLLRRAAARRRKPEGYAGPHAALLRAGDSAAGAERQARAGRRPRQLAARADHGAGKADAGADPEARTRHRRAGDLPAQCGFDGGVEGRSRGVTLMAIAIPDLSNEWDKVKLRNWMANAKTHN